MPIVGYNPDGTIRIARKSGKDAIDIKPEELGKYNANLEKEYNDTFNSAQGVASGDLKLTELPTDRRETVNTLIRSNPKISSDVRNDLAEKAQAVLDVLDAGKKGKLKGEAYKDALAAVASSFKGAKSFGEGGKALTTAELGVLSGQTPDISTREQSFIDRLTGYVPPADSELKDDEDTLRRKMQIAIKIAKKEKITDKDYANLSGTDKTEGFNVGGDVKNIINNILGMPAQAIERGKQAGLQAQQGDMSGIQGLQPNNLIFEMLKGYGQNLYKDVGSPLEGGDIVGRAEENLRQRPVSTALDVLPFMTKGLNMAKGKFTAKVPTGGDVPMTNKAGIGLRSRVRDIDIGPQIGGPQKEAVVNQRLNNMGIKGSPRQQYAQLQPKMEEISGKIDNYLQTNSKPIPVKDIRNAFDANLEEQIRTKSLNSKVAQAEAKGYVADLYKQTFGKTLTDEIQTSDLFTLKKKINQDYKSVQKKIDNGTSLTDREKVIAVSRKVVDDIITGEHPEIKEMTLDQSALYDATESLYKGRTKKPTLRLFGNPIPIPGGEAIQGGQDLVGRLLQGKL